MRRGFHTVSRELALKRAATLFSQQPTATAAGAQATQARLQEALGLPGMPTTPDNDEPEPEAEMRMESMDGEVDDAEGKDCVRGASPPR